MAELNQNGQNVNLIVKNDEDKDNEIVVSFPQVIRKLKKYFLPWLLTSIIVGGLISGVSILFSQTSTTPVTALVSFTYDGIEKGKNPDNSDFDSYSLINPMVVAQAIDECGLDPSILEDVREGFTILGINPSDVIDRITAYRDVYQTGGSGQLSAVQQMLAETWTPSQYKLSFDYRKAGLKRSDAVQLVNAIIQNAYPDYFFKKFGYNAPLGSSLSSMQYTDYDYAEAVDVFNTNLSTLKRYVNSLANDDTSRFRSTVTGASFADLREAINSIQDLDLALIDSYLTVNNITKDKERLEAYYQYRIEMLTRTQTNQQEVLETIDELLNNYEKDQVIVFSESATNVQSSVASDEYDKLINRKISAQSDLSDTKQSIAYYNQRLNTLRRSNIGNSTKVGKIEADLAAVNEKVQALIEKVKETADDYFENVSLSNSYNVLVPASADAVTSIKTGISNVFFPVVGLEIVLLMAYILVAFIQAIKAEHARRHPEEAAAAAARKAAAKQREAELAAEEKAAKESKKKG